MRDGDHIPFMEPPFKFSDQQCTNLKGETKTIPINDLKLGISLAI